MPCGFTVRQMEAAMEMRFDFGKNWQKFIAEHFSEERVAIARDALLSSLRKENLEGMSFLDIGCGSGLHSLSLSLSDTSGMEQVKICSFDYDQDAVECTRQLWLRSGSPESWKIM